MGDEMKKFELNLTKEERQDLQGAPGHVVDGSRRQHAEVALADEPLG